MNNVTRKHLKTAKAAWLYGNDGHLVIEHEERVGKNHVKVGYVTVHENLGLGRFPGRLVFHGAGLLWMLRDAVRLSPKAASYENGSDGSKERGLNVGSLVVDYPTGYVILNEIPGVLSAGYTYQPDHRAVYFEDDAALQRFGFDDLEVVEVVRERVSV